MRPLFIFFLLVQVLPALGQFNPQSKKMTAKFFADKEDLPNLSPALKKQEGFTNYDELIGFLEQLRQDHPEKSTLNYIGTSKKGYNIPLFRLHQNNGKPKVKIWMQGGLHGDEPGSTEAMLYLLHDLLNNSAHQDLIANIDLAVVPMANIDGYLKLERNNAEDLDLNRDQTKLMAIETPLLKKAFSDFRPQVALDFHEYRPFRKDYDKMSSFGVAGYYDVMFLNTGNLNVPASLRNFNQTQFLQPAKALLEANQLSYHDYFTTVQHFGATQFNLGSDNARSSVTNFSLQNTLATLVEVRGVGLGRTSFKRRIYTAYLIALSYLQTAVKEREAIENLLKTPSTERSEVVVNSSKKVYKKELDFIDLDQMERIKLSVTLRDALQSSPKLIRPMPEGYYILPEWKLLVDKIRLFGLKADSLEKSTRTFVQRYTILEHKSEPEKEEKMTRQEVQTQLDSVEMELPAGTYFIRMEQQAAMILPELLEPEASNSFVSFGVLPLKQGMVLPIFRKPLVKN